MLFYRVKNFVASPFFRYSITGGIGFVSNIALFSFFVATLNFPPFLSAFMAYFFAAIQNYLINHYWSFRGETGKSSPNFYGFVKFAVSSGIGVSLNLISLNILMSISVGVIEAQMLAVIISFVANYFMAKFFIYR